MDMSDDDKKKLKQLILELYMAGKIPYLMLGAGMVLYRVQSKKRDTANHYHTPVNLDELGRFNDPDFEMGVWYGADSPAVALAEILGREHATKTFNSTLYLNWDKDLKHRYMCEVEIQEPLKVLDIKRLITHLGVQLDAITSLNYSLTQEIVRVVSRLPDQQFSGIAYESRHYPDGTYCYALWKTAGQKAPLSEGNIELFGDYAHTGSIAKGFEGGTVLVEEILTEILGYRIT